MKNILAYVLSAGLITMAGCGTKQQTSTEQKSMFTGAKGEVKLITLDPGHFHAALVQKSMYEQVDSTVYVYALSVGCK